MMRNLLRNSCRLVLFVECKDYQNFIIMNTFPLIYSRLALEALSLLLISSFLGVSISLVMNIVNNRRGVHVFPLDEL